MVLILMFIHCSLSLVLSFWLSLCLPFLLFSFFLSLFLSFALSVFLSFSLSCFSSFRPTDLGFPSHWAILATLPHRLGIPKSNGSEMGTGFLSFSLLTWDSQVNVVFLQLCPTDLGFPSQMGVKWEPALGTMAPPTWESQVKWQKFSGLKAGK